MTSGPHRISLSGIEPRFKSESGSLQQVSASELGLLSRISIKRLLLAPGSIREPHWHANADELTYCLSGELLVSVLGDGDDFSSFRITAGQMFHVTSGAIHHIENIGQAEAELILAFSHESPEDFSMHAAYGAMSDAVLGNTYDLPSAAFAGIDRDTRPAYLLPRSGKPELPAGIDLENPARFDVEAQAAPINTPAWQAKLARKQFWPALRSLSMYSLRVTPEGMREPHWHPETSELGYVVSGRARMTIMDPDGTTDTYELSAGDVYFVPPAYPHHIEDIVSDAFHFLVFFDQPTPRDIGYRATGSAYSREVLAATLGVEPDELPELPFTPVDPLIVRRDNPLDG